MIVKDEFHYLHLQNHFDLFSIKIHLITQILH